MTSLNERIKILPVTRILVWLVLALAVILVLKVSGMFSTASPIHETPITAPPTAPLPATSNALSSATSSSIPAFAAATSKIAFVSNRDGEYEIYVMDSDGSNQLRLTGAADNFSPAWSPDGRKIAFVSCEANSRWDRERCCNIYITDAGGSKQLLLSKKRCGDSGVFDPAWSPDGTEIAATYWGWGAEIHIISADGTNEKILGGNRCFAGYAFSPAWSPDGKKIAFVSDSDANGSWRIHVMDANGNNLIPLASDVYDESLPVWVTNGYTRPEPTVVLNRRPIMPFKDLRRYSYSDSQPAWSPDGTKIAFASNRHGQWDIYVMNADGTRQTRLTDNFADDCCPSWSPDGRKIAFASCRDGNWEIYVMNADGSDQTRLTNNPRDDLDPAWSPK